MNWKNQTLKLLTALVVVLIILNPEMLQLDFLVDAVAPDIFLMLLEIQFLTLAGMFFNATIKPVLSYIINLYSRYSLIFSWKYVKEHPENLILAAPGQVALMQLMVFLYIVDVILNAHW